MITFGTRLFAAGLLGVSSGMRSMTPPAVLALSGRLTGVRAVRAGLCLAAVGELVGDKLPSAPSRTMPIAVVGRVGSGGVSGFAVAGPVGAVLGGGVAVVSTYQSHDLRAAAVLRSRLPDWPVALV